MKRLAFLLLIIIPLQLAAVFQITKTWWFDCIETSVAEGNRLATLHHGDYNESIVKLYDISNPTQPVYKSTVSNDVPLNIVDFAIRDTLLFIAEQQHITIFNIRDMANPQLITEYYSYYTNGMVISGNCMALSKTDSSLEIHNISNLQNIFLVESLTTPNLVAKMRTFDRYLLYQTAGNTPNLQAFSLSQNGHYIPKFSLNLDFLPLFVLESGNYLYIYRQPTIVEVYDTSDLSQAVFSQTIPLNHYAYSAWTENDKLYEIDDSERVLAHQVNADGSLTQTGQYQLYYTNHNKIWGVYTGVLYGCRWSHANGPNFAMDVSNPAPNPLTVWEFNPPNEVYYMGYNNADNGYLYYNNIDGLGIATLNAEGNIAQNVMDTRFFNVTKVKTFDDYLYLIDNSTNKRFKTLRLSHPELPRVVFTGFLNQGENFFVAGDRLILTQENNSWDSKYYYVYDNSNPQRPHQIDTFFVRGIYTLSMLDLEEYQHNFFGYTHYKGFIATRDETYYTQPTLPYLRGQSCDKIVLVPPYIYTFGTQSDGEMYTTMIQIYHTDIWGNITHVKDCYFGDANIRTFAKPMMLDDSYLIVPAMDSNGICLYDLEDRENPVLVTTEYLPYRIYDMVLANNKIYMAHGKAGFSCFDLSEYLDLPGELSLQEDQTSINVSIQGNPLSENSSLTIGSKTGETIELKLFNAKGQIISHLREQSVAKGQTSLLVKDLFPTASGLPNGVYFLQVRGNGISHTLKLLQMK